MHCHQETGKGMESSEESLYSQPIKDDAPMAISVVCFEPFHLSVKKVEQETRGIYRGEMLSELDCNWTTQKYILLEDLWSATNGSQFPSTVELSLYFVTQRKSVLGRRGTHIGARWGPRDTSVLARRKWLRIQYCGRSSSWQRSCSHFEW